MASINTISQSVKYGLHVTVTWPGTPLPKFRKFCWTFPAIVLQIYQYSYIFSHFESGNVIETADNLSITVAFTLMTLKLCIIWAQPRLVSLILSTMEEECRKYAFLDTNNFILKAANRSYRFTSIVIYIFLFAAAIHMSSTFIFRDRSETRELMLKMNLPFDTSESPIYEFVISMQIVYQTVTAYSFGVFAALLLMVVLHLGCQIDIMCHALMEIPYKRKEQLKFFISRHQEIIVFANRIEKLFTYMALGQLLSNTMISCILGYTIVMQIQMGNGLLPSMKYIMFYIGVCLELFVYCYAGEYLSSKSQLINDTAYKFLWYNLQPNEIRLLLLVILRSQKGFTLTFGKFANLSLESFMSIMKGSASYISVLLAMT
ncbi:unnamed protein product [Xylocopa violacea]|uniref:Odorant receptor n=1 Tax=Xylocopa violacea TaxID=135666 RepID=A0ABP1NL94_XYLVO